MEESVNFPLKLSYSLGDCDMLDELNVEFEGFQVSCKFHDYLKTNIYSLP